MPEGLRLKRSEYMKAHPLKYWQGKKRKWYTLSVEGRQRIIEGLKRRKISDKVIAHTAGLNKGKFGKEHPKWTDDKKRPLYQAIRSLFQYKKWRANIFERDNFTCQMCGKRGSDLEADHHPKQFIEIIRGNNIVSVENAIDCKELWLAQGRTFCKPCHQTTFRLSKR